MIVGVIHRRRTDVTDLNQHQLLPASKLLSQPLYCPLCRRELEGWGEGCTITHLYCKYCGLVIRLANKDILKPEDLDELENELLNAFDRVSSRW